MECSLTRPSRPTTPVTTPVREAGICGDAVFTTARADWFGAWTVSSGVPRAAEITEVRRGAGEELRSASKEYFGYAADLPLRDRERAQQRYRDWWVTEGRARHRNRG